MEKMNPKNKIYSPLRYPGGKNCIFPFVSKMLEENGLIGISYAEPYAGGCGLALRLLFEGYVSKIYINDLDYSIFSFWNAVLNRTEQFCNWLENVEVSVDSWFYYKSIQDNIDDYNYLDIAKSTFFLNRTNVSGVIKGGIIGGIQQHGKYKVDARFNKAELLERIRRIAVLRDMIVLSNFDGVFFIKRINNSKENAFIYLDPPYVQKGADLYMNSYSHADHKNLARYVAKMDKPWMVSYDYHDFIINLYKKNSKVQYKLSQCASNRIGDEILIFSDAVSFDESLKSLRSPVVIG